MAARLSRGPLAVLPLVVLAACSQHRSDGVAVNHPVFASAVAVPAMPMAAATAGADAAAATPGASDMPAADKGSMVPTAAAAAMAEPSIESTVSEGWQGLMWGMNRGDIRQVMPAVADIKERVGKTERTVFGLDSYALPGCTARALMDFTPAGELQAVRVVSRGATDAACVRTVRQGLADKYGSAAHEEKPRGGLDIHNAVWRAPGVVISLTSSIDGKGQGLFQIAYANPAPSAQAPQGAAPSDPKARL